MARYEHELAVQKATRGLWQGGNQINTNKNVVISTGSGGKISHHTAYRLANDADFFYTLSNIPAY